MDIHENQVRRIVFPAIVLFGRHFGTSSDFNFRGKAGQYGSQKFLYCILPEIKKRELPEKLLRQFPFPYRSTLFDFIKNTKIIILFLFYKGYWLFP